MGVVYKALDPVIDRVVAVKTISTQQDGIDASQIERLLTEARSAGRLHHNNIVTVFDFGQIGDTAYIVLEYVEGVDVAQLIATGEPVALPQKIDIILQICEGLGFAHDRGVTHRDMKPSNVRLTANGTAKILDFGLARFDDTQLTKTGYISGTIAYMSPERINGQTGSSDDIFALGASAYEILTYRRAFPGASAPEVMFKILTEPPAAPSTIAELPPVLDAVFMKCLAREVSDRWSSPHEFALALEEAFESDAAQSFVIDPARSDAFKNAYLRWSPRRRARDTRSRSTFSPATASGDTPTQVFSSTSAGTAMTAKTAVERSPSSDLTITSQPMTSQATEVLKHPRSRPSWAGLAAGVTIVAVLAVLAVTLRRPLPPEEPYPQSSRTPASTSEVLVQTDTTPRITPEPVAEATQLGAPIQGAATSGVTVTSTPVKQGTQTRRRPLQLPSMQPAALPPTQILVESKSRPEPQPPAQDEKPAAPSPGTAQPQPQIAELREEIASFISSVAAAYESRDGAFFRENHLGYTDAMGNAVRNSPSRRVRLEVLSIATPAPNQARVLVERMDEFTGGAPSGKQRLTFVLERLGSGWKIRRFERS